MSELRRRMMMQQAGGGEPYILLNADSYTLLPTLNEMGFANGATLGIECIFELVDWNDGYIAFYGTWNGGYEGISLTTYYNDLIVSLNRAQRNRSATILEGIRYTVQHNLYQSGVATLNGEVLSPVGRFNLDGVNKAVPYGIGCYVTRTGAIDAGSAKVKFYQITMTKGNNVYAILKPAVVEGVAGFYDEINDNFYPSASIVPFEYYEK